MVFFGEYQVSFSGAGRLLLPKKIRELLNANNFVISKGFDNCLSGYNRQDWEVRAQDLLNVSLLDKEQIDKRRFLFSSAVVVDIDEQGRFVLPKNLLQYAALDEKTVTIAGVGDHFEIWRSDRWTSYLEHSL